MFRARFETLRRESLYANSVFLLSSSLLLSALGFVFWTLCAHLYTTAQIGTATVLLSVVNLISSLALLGLEISIIRVLPGHKDKSALVNTSLSLTGLIGICAAALFVVFQPVISPRLGILRENGWITMLFVVYALASVASYIVESTLVAYRKSQYVLYKNGIFSVLKVVLAIAFIGFGAFGVYSAWMVSLAIAVLYSLGVLRKKLGHSFKASFRLKPLEGMVRYSLANYVSAFIEGLPVILLPLLISNFFGPVANAYYYIAMTFATMLYTVAVAATQSLFAEGSHSVSEIKAKVNKAMKFTGLLLLPGVVGLLLLGHYILLIFFGRDYASQASTLLDILAVSAIPIALNTIGATLLRVHYKMKYLLATDVIGTAPILIFAYAFRSMGLNGIGWAWLLGQLVTLGAFGCIFLRDRSLFSPAITADAALVQA